MISCIGFLFIIICVVYLFCCSIFNKFKCKNVATTIILIICISIVLIYYDNIEEISIKDFIKIKIAKKQAYDALKSIDSLKTQIGKDAKELSELKAKLNSTFTINSSGQIEWLRQQNVGNTYWGLNPGVVMQSWINISSASADGTTHGFAPWNIGGYIPVYITRDSDGAGDSDTPRVSINGVLELTPQSTVPSPAKEGMFYYDLNDHKFKVYNGSSWKVITKD